MLLPNPLNKAISSLKTGKRLLVAAFLVLQVSPLQASNEHLSGTGGYTCENLDFCVSWSSESMSRSPLSENFSFAQADLEIRSSQMDLPKTQFKGFSGSYDSAINRFYLSKKGLSTEYVIDLKTQKVIVYNLDQ